MERLKKAFAAFDKAQSVMLVILLPICIATVFFVIFLLIPYTPVKIYEKNILPAEVCPGENLEVVLDWEITDPLNRLHIEYYWSLEGEEPASFGGTAQLNNVEVIPREVVKSPLQRVAPIEPGEWRLVTDYDAYGEQWGIPQRQDFQVQSDDVVYVKPLEECE